MRQKSIELSSVILNNVENPKHPFAFNRFSTIIQNDKLYDSIIRLSTHPLSFISNNYY